MEFLSVPVGSKFVFPGRGTVFVKISPKSYAAVAPGTYAAPGTAVLLSARRCKGSGRYFMPKADPNPVVDVVKD
jgi:hypothetical protein